MNCSMQKSPWSSLLANHSRPRFFPKAIHLVAIEVNLKELEATSQDPGRTSIHLVDFEVNLKELEATSQDLGRPSIHLVDFEVNLKELEATSQDLGRLSLHLVDFEVNLKELEATLQDLGRLGKTKSVIACSWLWTFSLDIFLANYSLGQSFGKICWRALVPAFLELCCL